MYKLNRKIVKSLSLPGYYNDGFGLYLQVSKSGGKTWIYRYKLHGRRRDMGLGPLSIANHINVAREKAENARALVKSGIDPIDSRRHTQAKQVVEVEARMNFRDVIEKFFQAKDDAGYFRTEQTRRRWYFCLTTHASRLHPMELKDINARSVYETVLPLWKDKTETASRTRLY